MRRELDVGFALGIDRCRDDRHEGRIAHIRARSARDPNFELAIAKAEEHNMAYRVGMTGVGHDDEPESSQQKFGNFPELDDNYDNNHDMTTTRWVVLRF